MSAKIEDQIIISEISNQNRKVYEALFYEYYPHLVRFADNFLFDIAASEDIVQSFFVYFWENVSSIRIENSIKSYFFQSIKNRCYNRLRDLHIQDRHNLLYMNALLKQEDYDFAGEPEIVKLVESAIESLPPQMSEIFRMKYIEEQKIKEIARTMSISENTVKTQLQRAKEKLRETMLRKSGIYFFL